MLECATFYFSLIVCMSLGGYYKKIDDIEMKRNYGAGLGLLVCCLICGSQMYHSIFMVWGNIIIIKCCNKSYVHQMSLAYTWTYLVYLHFNLKCALFVVWIHQTLALRLVGLAFEVHMASTEKYRASTSKALTEKQDGDSFESLFSDPPAVGIISYAYFFIGLHRGPYYRYKIFEEHFRAPFGMLGDCRVITEHKLKKALVCWLGYVMLGLKYGGAYQDNDYYRELGSEFRYLYNLPQLISYFLYRQMLTMLCTAVCTETGFGVYPAKCDPMPGHGPTAANSLLKIASSKTEVAMQQEYNFSMLKCYDNEKVLLGPTMADSIYGWDMPTRYWFSTYLFKNLVPGSKELRSACAFAAWCAWVGPTVPHAILCATLYVYVHLEAEYIQLYNSFGSFKMAQNVGFSVMRALCLLYLAPCLVLQDTPATMRYYNSVYWVFHVVLIMLLFTIAAAQKLMRSRFHRSPA